MISKQLAPQKFCLAIWQRVEEAFCSFAFITANSCYDIDCSMRLLALMPPKRLYHAKVMTKRKLFWLVFPNVAGIQKRRKVPWSTKSWSWNQICSKFRSLSSASMKVEPRLWTTSSISTIRTLAVSLLLQKPMTAFIVISRAMVYLHFVDWLSFFVLLMLLFLLLLLAFVKNKGLNGAHKCSAEDVDKEDSNEDGSILLGSDDSPTIMSNNSKKPAGKPKVMAPNPTKKPWPCFQYMMEKMKLTSKEMEGWELDCVHHTIGEPTNSIPSATSILSCFARAPHHQCIASPRSLLMESTFTSARRSHPASLTWYANSSLGNQLADNAAECSAVVYHEGLSAMNKLEEAFNMEDIKPLVTVKLPFAVKQDFEDPYHPNQLGYQFLSFPHRGGCKLPLPNLLSLHGRSSWTLQEATPQHWTFA